MSVNSDRKVILSALTALQQELAKPLDASKRTPIQDLNLLIPHAKKFLATYTRMVGEGGSQLGVEKSTADTMSLFARLLQSVVDNTVASNEAQVIRAKLATMVATLIPALSSVVPPPVSAPASNRKALLPALKELQGKLALPGVSPAVLKGHLMDYEQDYSELIDDHEDRYPPGESPNRIPFGVGLETDKAIDAIASGVEKIVEDELPEGKIPAALAAMRRLVDFVISTMEGAPDDAEMSGGRRRKTRKSRKSRRKTRKSTHRRKAF